MPRTVTEPQVGIGLQNPLKQNKPHTSTTAVTQQSIL